MTERNAVFTQEVVNVLAYKEPQLTEWLQSRVRAVLAADRSALLRTLLLTASECESLRAAFPASRYDWETLDYDDVGLLLANPGFYLFDKLSERSLVTIHYEEATDSWRAAFRGQSMLILLSVIDAVQFSASRYEEVQEKLSRAGYGIHVGETVEELRAQIKAEKERR
jgi:hypothetical protein